MKTFNWTAMSEQMKNSSLKSVKNEGELEAENFIDASKQIIQIQEIRGEAKKITITIEEK
jgi:hypothetical protein